MVMRRKIYMLIFSFFSLFLLSSIAINCAPYYIIPNQTNYSNLKLSIHNNSNNFLYDIEFDLNNFSEGEKIYDNITIELSNGISSQSFILDAFSLPGKTKDIIQTTVIFNTRYDKVSLYTLDETNIKNLQCTYTIEDTNNWFLEHGYKIFAVVFILLVSIFVTLYWKLQNKLFFALAIIVALIYIIFINVLSFFINIDILTLVLSFIAILLPIIKELFIDKKI